MKRVKLDVEGMHCSGCASRVEAALSAVEGVRRVDVSLEEAEAEVLADDPAGEDALLRAVEGAGYGAKPTEA